LRETNEWITGYFICKTCATVAQDAALTVEQYEITYWDWLFVMALLFDKATFACTMTKCLVLQWAFAALVTHWTIQGVIRKEEFNHSFMRTLHLWRIGTHNLSLGYWSHTANNHHRAAWPFDFNKTLATHSH
jgi:hypothetical protein